MGDLTSAIIGAESAGNPYARNSRSSAAGLGQFIDSTWLATLAKHRPDLAQGKTRAQILQMKFDPAVSREMTERYAADNQGFLSARGIEATPGNTYLAHFAGPRGAAAIHANPAAPVEQLLGARAVAANPFLRGKTGADVIGWAAGKVDGKKGTPMATIPGVAPQPMPVAGTTGGGLPDFGPMPSERRKAMAEALLGQSFRTANSATNPLGALAAIAQAGVGSYLGGKYDDEKTARNRKLAEAMLGAGDNDALLRTMFASGDDDLVKAATSQKLAAMKPQTQVGRFRPSKQGVVDTVTGQIVPGTEASGTEAAEHGTTPVPWIDKDGNLHYTQLSKAGGRKDLELPEGARWAPGYDFKDTGTEFTGMNKKTGAAEVIAPKNIAGKEAQEEVGKLGGQAQVALPAAKTMVDNARQTIAELRKHPGLETGTGASNVFDPTSWIPGTASYDFQAKNKQAQGQSFMAARDALKGAGQVTDFEGAKGEQAIANLDAAQSKEQYLAALDTLERMMRNSYLDLERKAAGARSGGSVAAPPPGGERVRIDLGADQPSRPASQQEYEALPSGARFIDPDGNTRVKP